MLSQGTLFSLHNDLKRRLLVSCFFYLLFARNLDSVPFRRSTPLKTGRGNEPVKREGPKVMFLFCDARSRTVRHGTVGVCHVKHRLVWSGWISHVST